MISTRTIKSSTRAALAALIIGGASVAAMPAQAAGASFGFSFNAGNGLTFSITEGQQQRRAHPRFNRHRACLNNQAIRQDLRQAGFRNIRFVKKNGKRARIVAKRGRWEYVLRVNRCNGNVATLDRYKIRRHQPAQRRNQPVQRGDLMLNFNFR